MPEAPKADYNEAREIVGLSPRGACALLRLALQIVEQLIAQPRHMEELYKKLPQGTLDQIEARDN